MLHDIPYALKLNLKSEPTGVDPACLRFSWRQPDGGQTAARVRVLKGTSPDGAVLYDSGLLPGGSCTSVCLPGLDGTLPSPGLYAWQVSVRMTDGTLTALSDPQPFFADDGRTWDPVRGVAVPDGVWPAPPETIPEGCVPGVTGFVRQSFMLSAADLASLDRVIITSTGRTPEKGRQYVYTLSVNGQAVCVGPSRYGQTPAGETVLTTQSCDVTDLLTAGENTVASALSCAGNSAARMFACRALAFMRDGSVRSLLDPDSWRGLDGTAALRPRFSIGTGYFTSFASDIDGRVFPFGFDRPGFDASGWTVCARKGPITACGVPEDPTGDRMVLRPAVYDTVSRFPLTDPTPRVLCIGEGHYLVDLGQEIIGSLSLDVPLFRARLVPQITLYFGEQCRQAVGEDGTYVKWNMNTSNRYRQEWILVPGKTFETNDFMAFRYAELCGVPFELTPDMVHGVSVRRAFDGSEASLDTDNCLLRDLYRLTGNTIKYTTQDIYVDSQSRERGAYEGDALINELAAYTFEDDYAAARATLEYLYTHRTWPADYILWILEAALHDCLVTGDDSSLRAWYPCLREKTFTRFFSDEYDLVHSGNPGGNSVDAILVDWPHSERDGYDMKVRYNTVFNCAAAAGYDALAQIARIVGEDADRKAFAALAARLRHGILTHLFDEQSGCFCDGLYEDGTRSPHVSQHAQAYALYTGVYADKAMADRVAEGLWSRSLVTDPDGRTRGTIRMSVYGTYFLLMGLYKTGHGDMANALLLDEHDAAGERTYAYMLHRSVGEDASPFGAPVGATLTTEAWNRQNKPNMTYSHPWGAAVAAAISRGIFGVVPTEPGYAHFTVSPGTSDALCASGLTRGAISIPTLRGIIRVRFDNTAADPADRVTVEAPVGMTFDIIGVCGALPRTPLKGFLEEALKDPKNFQGK